MSRQTSQCNVVQSVAAAWPPADWADLHVLVAVSGGADSVGLLCALAEIKATNGGAGRLIVGHFNHRLRGDESDVDERFVRQLAAESNLTIEVGCAQGPMASEDTARQARYEFLTQAAERVGVRFIATAHTADDQVETVLHHIIRGTGLAGLAGIPAVRPVTQSVALVRPLLGVQRTEIIAYLANRGQTFHTDRTNLDCQFTRNRLRHELLPLLRENYNAEVDEALRRLAQQAADGEALIRQLAQPLFESMVDTSRVPAMLVIDRTLLNGVPQALVRAVCRIAWQAAGWPEQAMSFGHWCELAQLVTADAPSGVFMFPGKIQVERIGERTSLTLQP